MSDQCSPERSDKYKNSCLSFDEAKILASLYNKNNPLNKIPESEFKNRKLLVAALDTKFSKVCDGEACWLGQYQESKHIMDHAFKPVKPKSWALNKRQWLSNYDIQDVMRQYERKYENFKFIGSLPVDFAESYNDDRCIVKDMCRFDINQLKEKNKTCFGIVMNLDKHDQPGSHWVACFCSLDPSDQKYGISYYDSGASRPPKLISKFMKLVQSQIDDVKFKVRRNRKVHQFKDTECGIFSMWFIITCLDNPQLDFSRCLKLIKIDKNDNAAFSKRNDFFR